LFELDPAMVELLPRQELEPEQESAGVVAAVRLDDANDDVAAFLTLDASRLEHRVGLPDPGRGAEEAGELARAGSPFLAPYVGEKSIRIGSLSHTPVHTTAPVRRRIGPVRRANSDGHRSWLAHVSNPLEINAAYEGASTGTSKHRERRRALRGRARFRDSAE